MYRFLPEEQIHPGMHPFYILCSLNLHTIKKKYNSHSLASLKQSNARLHRKALDGAHAPPQHASELHCSILVGSSVTR